MCDTDYFDELEIEDAATAGLFDECNDDQHIEVYSEGGFHTHPESGCGGCLVMITAAILLLAGALAALAH